MPLNDEQQRAVSSRVPVVLVSAGAGSGKTRVLTERYLDLLTERRAQEGRVPLDRLLTLTFTRKAAQEMRERIARGLEARGLGHLRPELMRAPIGTIHGFCERVLRERALAAGIDPNFRVLDDAESGTLLEHALDAVFGLFWDGGQRAEASGRGEIIRLLLAFPHREVRAALLTRYRALRTRGIDLDDLRPVPAASLDDAARALFDAIDALLALPGTPKWQEGLRAARAARDMLQNLLPVDDGFDWAVHDAVEALQSPLTPNGGPKELAKAARDAIKAALAAWLAAYLDRAAAPHLRAFAALLRQLDRAYREAKDEQGLLDFEDLLLLTRDLLRDGSGDAGRFYRARFFQVMVDEFQDTNPLQFSLIRAFRGEGHLFMVGDVKQSIYRFIGSDVGVFLAQEDGVAALGDAGQRIAMHTNYRSRPEVLAPLNALFARLWAAGAPFAFEPLAAGSRFIARDDPAVEVALWPAQEGDAAELRDREAAWIARRILQLTDQAGAPLLVTADSDDPDAPPAARPAGFGDIIVLFRASTDIPRYEAALRRAGIPHYVVSGRGFYQAREVQDLMFLLAVLENPCDDFALATVLRSPLVGVSDETLYWLARDWAAWTADAPLPAEIRVEPKYGRLWEAVARAEALPPIPADERAALTRFHALVLDLQAELPAGQPLDLFDRILDETGYATGLLAMEDGEQRYANVQKLREVAAAFQHRGIFDLTDFRRYLAQLEELAPREPSAPLDTEGSPVVRLMTIHAAKGLEAPVVFLADMGREPNAAYPAFLLADDTLACKLPTPEDGWAQPASYRDVLQREREAERREAERLLYVALTRAREQLICCGTATFGTETGRDSDLLAALLELAPGQAGDELYRDVPLGEGGGAVRVWSPDALRALEALETPAPPPTLWEQHSEAILAAAPLPVPTDAGEVEAFTRMVARLGALPPARRDGPLRVGVHRALCYAKCPRQYWFRYVLKREGVVARPPDEEGTPAGPDGDDEAARTDGTTLGTLLHGVLQRVPLDGGLLAALPAALDDAARVAEVVPDAELRRAVEAPLRRLMALPVFADLRAADDVHRELPFFARVGGVSLPGIIDVLARTGDRWWILDYKTGHPSADHARQVGLYALGVRHALGVTPERVVVAYLGDDGGRPLRDERVTPGMLDDAYRLIAGVGDGLRQGVFPPAPGRHCATCPFLAACPAGAAAPASAR